MLRFIESFDHYTSSADLALKWNTNATINTSNGRYSNAISSNGQYIYKIFDNQATWIVGFAFKPTPSIGNAGSILSFSDIVNNSQVELRVNANNTLSVTRNGAALTNGTSTTTITLNTYQYIEMKVTISTSIAAGSCIVRMNGVTIITVATGQSTQNTGNAYASYIGFNSWPGTAIYSNYGGGISYYDDIYICDGTGSTNNGLLGDCRVEAIFPNAAGDTTQWTPLSGTNFSNVNETAENADTSYVSDATVGDYDFYKYGALSSTPVNIYGVQVNLVARKDDAGTRQVVPAIRMASTNYDGATTITLSTSYNFYSQIWETNPNTSAAWTAANLASATFQAGIKVLA